MATVVQHNAAAQLALGELNKNVSKVGKLLTKLSTGQKINSAQDDSASFCISEKMREQIRSLLQDNQNVQNGSALFKVADGGISSIVEELRNLKELAINSANDTNTDVDRLTIQKEFSQKMANINDIATETNYNGKTLLDGTYSESIGRFQTQTVFKGREWVPPGQGGSSEIPPPPYTSIYKAVTEETDTDATVTISGTDYTIDEDGIYSIAADFTGTITVEAQNVKITQASSATLSEVSIVGPEGGNANLWIEGLNISNSTDNIIKFQGSGNVLTVKGTNVLTEQNSKMAAINIGGGLNVQGNGSHSLKITTPSGSNGAAIGSNGGESSNIGDLGVYNLNMVDSYACYGSVIGSGGNSGSIGKVTVEKSTINAKGFYNAIIGAGYGSAKSGDIWVVNSSVGIGKVGGSQGLVDTGIGSGYAGSEAGNIYILNSSVEVHNELSACIGAGDAAKCGDIFISASKIKGQSYTGACVGSGQGGSTAGEITITNATAISHVSPNGAAIGTGSNGKVGKITVTQSSLNLLDASQAYSDGTHKYKGIGRGRNGKADNITANVYNQRPGYWRDVYEQTVTAIDTDVFNPLTIHHGTQANQAINFFIEDMHTKSLGTDALLQGGLPADESDLERYHALSYDKKLQQEFLRTLSNASYKTLDDIEVTTQFDANVAIRVLDSAIEYALNEATRIGSYLQRLNYTDVNITTMGENVQSAESVIRDADMAKEMTEYTKYNVLTQSAQAMLAQANQNSSGVLSLLQ